jgi:hypothetical protein
MTTVTEHEQSQVDEANASGKTPVVFVHPASAGSGPRATSGCSEGSRRPIRRLADSRRLDDASVRHGPRALATGRQNGR